MSDPTATAEDRARTCAAMLGSIQMYGNAGDLATADRFYSSICNTYMRFSTELPLRDGLAKGAVMMAYFCGRGGDLDEANGFIDDLRALCAENPGEEPLGDVLADALSTQAIHYTHRQESKKVYDIYHELRALAEQLPARVFVQEQFALTAYNLSVGLHTAHAVDELTLIARELHALSVRVPVSAEIRSSLGKLIFNLITLELRERPEAAQKLYVQLRTIAQSHPSELDLRMQAAMSACNLATQVAALGRLQDAMRLYDDLVQWAERHPDDRQLREQRVRTARNILVMSDVGWDAQTGWKLYRDAVDAVAADPENENLREFAGESAHAIWIDAVMRGDVGKAELAYLELAGLANHYPADAHLREYVDKIRQLRQSLPA